MFVEEENEILKDLKAGSNVAGLSMRGGCKGVVGLWDGDGVLGEVVDGVGLFWLGILVLGCVVNGCVVIGVVVMVAVGMFVLGSFVNGCFVNGCVVIGCVVGCVDDGVCVVGI